MIAWLIIGKDVNIMSRKDASPPHYKVWFYIAYKSEDSALNISHVTKLVKTLSFLQDKDSEC